ncbi:DUF4132 domain-containing protein [Plantactinospora sp. B24E8]|uniref:DUF4132 domain-containing protein n=1 Tax=Plantactinospora sp. B24E8 TaxID=3153567 RepID=UPI00325E1979
MTTATGDRRSHLDDLVAAGRLDELARHLRVNLGSSTTDEAVRRALRGLSREQMVELIRVLAAAVPPSSRMSWREQDLVRELARRLPEDVSATVAAELLAFAVRNPNAMPPAALATLVRRAHPDGNPPDEVRKLVQDRSGESPHLRQLLADLVGPSVRRGDPWADRILADLPGLEPAWTKLVGHASTATSARPSADWRRGAEALLSTMEAARVRAVLGDWVATATRTPHRQPDPLNADTLRGLLWVLEVVGPAPEQVRMLAALVEAMLRRLPGIGPASPKLANAAVGVLGRLDGEDALGQLARLVNRISYRGTLNEINKALAVRAEALGLSRDEIEELAVPDYGLTDVGRHTVRFAAGRAELEIQAGTVTVTWFTDAGRQVKSPPAAVRRDQPGELAELKAMVKELSAMLSAQSARLDGLFLARREWSAPVWRERYLDHPLVGTLARRLIWVVDGVPCGYADGVLRTVSDAEHVVGDAARVELWHPIGRPVPEVVAWREWLERHRVVQPFKQAHREVYLLTPAEEQTGTYSNRFAGHVLRQHQFHALAAARGWRDKLRLSVDDTYPPPVRELPRWGLRAEYWVEGVGDEYGVDTTESGAYLRLATDQVRFYPIDADSNWTHAWTGGYSASGGAWDNPEPVPALRLDQIPALVFSEIMRDVDLFVGVASIGNDPTWSDGGPQGRFRDYWASYSFGELSETARTRQQILTRLLPRLSVGARATIDGRFLVVRGDLRTYKIHLGSGNILMSPNDRYLCVVPARGAAAGAGTERQFLPFEGDGLLAVILSKAMLLADDSAITDPSITRQFEVA